MPAQSEPVFVIDHIETEPMTAQQYEQSVATIAAMISEWIDEKQSR